jgi:peptidoglycan/xylan/chitin deacetylase (PgdA/CDA1 family)
VSLKRRALSILTHPLALGLTAGATRGAVPILMMHRFADPAAGNDGHDPALLRARLTELRARKFSPLALDDALRRLEGGESLARTVVFTVDDGYDDFRRVAAPIFAEFECPVTVFVTTGFIDGALWFWWDQLEYMLEHSARHELELRLDAAPLKRTWASPVERSAVLEQLVERLKRVDNAARENALRALSEGLDVAVPAKAPARYAPMTWDALRVLERAGAAFGAHSRTHPILSRVDDGQCDAEIAGSWKRLGEEVRAPSRVFCYPNGTVEDFGARETTIVAREQFQAAVSTIPGFATAADFASRRYAVPRFPYFEGAEDFWQVVGGVERLKEKLRGH